MQRYLARLSSHLPPPGEASVAWPRTSDLVLSGLFTITWLVELAVWDPPRRWVILVIGVLGLAVSVFRRVVPFISLLLMLGLMIGRNLVEIASDEHLDGTYGVALAFTAIGYAAVRWTATSTAVLATILLLAVPSIGEEFATGQGREALLVGTTIAAFAWFMRARSAMFADQARRVDAERREELAAVIHDRVAHHLSAITLRAEPTSLQDAPRESVLAALADIRSTAGDALIDMRSLVASLRDEVGDSVELANLDQFRELARDANSAVLHVALTIDTLVEGPTREVCHAITEITREAITNSRFHAKGAEEITIHLGEQGSSFVLSIRDDGRTHSAEPTRTGVGLRSMTDRAGAVGGHLEAGPISGGGWSVRATFPIPRGDDS